MSPSPNLRTENRKGQTHRDSRSALNWTLSAAWGSQLPTLHKDDDCSFNQHENQLLPAWTEEDAIFLIQPSKTQQPLRLQHKPLIQCLKGECRETAWTWTELNLFSWLKGAMCSLLRRNRLRSTNNRACASNYTFKQKGLHTGCEPARLRVHHHVHHRVSLTDHMTVIRINTRHLMLTTSGPLRFTLWPLPGSQPHVGLSVCQLLLPADVWLYLQHHTHTHTPGERHSAKRLSTLFINTSCIKSRTETHEVKPVTVSGLRRSHTGSLWFEVTERLPEFSCVSVFWQRSNRELNLKFVHLYKR